MNLLTDFSRLDEFLSISPNKLKELRAQLILELQESYTRIGQNSSEEHLIEHVNTLEDKIEILDFILKEIIPIPLDQIPETIEILFSELESLRAEYLETENAVDSIGGCDNDRLEEIFDKLRGKQQYVDLLQYISNKHRFELQVR
jgi:hypothetical protein